MQVAGLPLQLPLLFLTRHLRVWLPLSSKPSSQVNVHVSPLVGATSSPSEQSIPPLSGAVSGGHVPSETGITKKAINLKLYFALGIKLCYDYNGKMHGYLNLKL